jgi:hypothetical protein
MTSQIVPLTMFSPWYGKLVNVKAFVHNNKKLQMKVMCDCISLFKKTIDLKQCSHSTKPRT